jgi:hypothetical protein
MRVVFVQRADFGNKKKVLVPAIVLGFRKLRKGFGLHHGTSQGFHRPVVIII